MNHTETKERAVYWAAPMLLGLVLIFGGTLAGAIMLSAGILGQKLAPIAAYFPLMLGSFVSAFWGARRAENRKFLMGMLVSCFLLGCLFLLGLTMQDNAFSAPAAGITTGILLAAACLGAIPGAAANKKKKRRR